ncbi:hypothetical protein BBJ29_004303 [Phytophthora kernoviae]|uniref:Non-specific serine/threonine protein kinase n=1 Tax=Phytophthora kernoviae TaxID=325452 RepID=A0A3F2RMH6_9STRA|nr:hypothetical protein BBJ29_004303 [Phytophthora kernoviae]RLN60095.1 hypothetical protein BBP00_00006170 [Phytophthora kernoviae]
MICSSENSGYGENQTGEKAADKAEGGSDNDLAPRVVVLELSAKEKLGVKPMAPKDGVINHGLAIDNIINPLLKDKVQAGDLLVAIGGQSVDGMYFSSAIELFRKMPRPLAISFEIDELRRQQVMQEKSQANKDNDLDSQLTTYAVVFCNGTMGLNLEEAVRYGIDGAVVRAVKGQARTSGMITVGDIVYKVNETDVLCMPYSKVMNVLRNAPAPKTLQFVPKDKLADVQRVNFQYSKSFRLRESTSHVKQILMNNPRIVKDEGNDGDDNQSIAQLLLDNKAETIKMGRVYKQGHVMRNWKSRYFVLSVSKVEYFKSPSSTTARGEISFLNHRCTVRSLPGTGDVVCRSPNVTAEYLLELRVDDRRMVMACTSELDKKGWMDAFKLAIDASKIVNRTQNLEESLREDKALCTHRTESLSVDGSATFLDRNAGDHLSQFNYKAFSTPMVHVAVLSATNLTKSGSSMNAICEVTVGAEMFKTSVVKNQRSPVWKQDNAASFEAPYDDMMVEIRIFDERMFRATELITTLTIPLKSLINMQKATKEYPLAVGSRTAGSVLTLSLEYVNKQKAYEDTMDERDKMVKFRAEAQMAEDEDTYHAARAQEEARMLFEPFRQKLDDEFFRRGAFGKIYRGNKDIVHSDLKGDNILVEGDKAMLADFGMSFFRSGNKPRFDNVGAIRWRAPEFITQGPSFEADVYSLGMCIVEAMTGKPPWGSRPDVSVRWHLNNGKFLTQPKCMSDVEWSLIRGMCAFDPAQRMALDEVENIVKEFAENEEDNERMGSYV